MSHQEQLAQAIAEFQQWRLTRQSRNEHTPIKLRQLAVKLRLHYSTQKISTALRLSGTQLKQWSLDGQSTKEPPEFTPLPITTGVPGEPPSDALTIELTLGNGAQLSLSGDISTAMLATLLQGINT